MMTKGLNGNKDRQNCKNGFLIDYHYLRDINLKKDAE